MLKNHRNYWAILSCGLILIFDAGYINSIALVGQLSKTVTHMTGNVTNMSVHIATGEYFIALDYFIVILFFLFGAILSGILVPRVKFSLTIDYSLALLIQTAALSIAFLVFNIYTDYHVLIAGYFLAFSAGMQNALVTKFSGAEIRTTHVTGLLTDLGIEIGHALRKEHDAKQSKLRLFVLTLICFSLGCITGTIVAAKVFTYALIYPIILNIFLISAHQGYHLLKKNKKNN